MKKDFDFDALGKQTPYRTPDGFFESVQQHILEQVAKERRPAWRFRRWAVAGMAVAAVWAVLVVFLPGLWWETEKSASTEVLAVETVGVSVSDEHWIEKLSDEELEELVNFSEDDVFLDKLTLLTF